MTSTNKQRKPWNRRYAWRQNRPCGRKEDTYCNGRWERGFQQQPQMTFHQTHWKWNAKGQQNLSPADQLHFQKYHLIQLMIQYLIRHRLQLPIRHAKKKFYFGVVDFYPSKSPKICKNAIAFLNRFTYSPPRQRNYRVHWTSRHFTLEWPSCLEKRLDCTKTTDSAVYARNWRNSLSPLATPMVRYKR